MHNEGPKSLEEASGSLLLRDSGQAVDEALIPRDDRNNFAASVQVVHDSATALNVHSVQNGLYGEEEGLGGETSHN